MKKDSKQTQLTPLENALQRQFKPSANSVREAFKIVEDSRSAFATNAVRFGLCALAAKPIVGHGNFGKWLSDSLFENGNPRPLAERTARDYIGLAKVFVQKLHHPNKLSDALAAGVSEFCEFCNIDRDEFDIEKILADKTQTEDLLRRTLSGMTLPQLRNLLREGAVKALAATAAGSLRRCSSGTTGQTALPNSTSLQSTRTSSACRSKNSCSSKNRSKTGSTKSRT